MRICRALCGVLLAVAGAPLSLGQSKATQAASEAPPTIRTSAAEVLLDVVVRDRRGRLVRNLSPDDIEIYENGVKQQIRAFRFAGAERRRTESRGGEPTVRQTAQQAAAGPLPLRALNLLCIVFHNLDPVNRVRAQKLAEALLQEEFPPNTLAGVFVLDDYLTPVSSFTDQKQDLLAAVQQAFSGRALDFQQASVAVLTASPSEYTVTALVDMAAHSATVTDRVTGGEVSRLVVPRAEVSTSLSANTTRGYQARDRVDMAHVTGSRAMDQIATMVSQLEKLPGRKSVVLVSGGLLTTGDPDAFGKLVARANAANMTIYSFDPTELNETTDTQAAKIALSQVADVSRTQTDVRRQPSLTERRQQSRQGDALEVAVRSSDLRAALRELAEGTGGFLVANTSEFRKPFQRVIEELEARYEVAYRPADLKLDGRLRTIEVRTRRKDLVIESRSGYFALPLEHGERPLQPHEVVGLALLGAERPPEQFPFETGVYTFGASDGRRQVAFAFEVQGKELATEQDAASGIARAHLSLVGLVKDAGGEVVDKFSIDAPYQFALANLDAMRASPITHAQPLDLAPGHYLLEVAMLDRAGARVSTKRLEVEVPAPAAGPAISTPMLVQSVQEAVGGGHGDPLVYQGRRVVPLVSPVLAPSMQPYVYFIVYPDRKRSEKAELTVEFFVNGQRLAAQNSELPLPDPSGAVPMMVGAAMRPGLCEVRLTARQGDAAATSSVRYVVPHSQTQQGRLQ